MTLKAGTKTTTVTYPAQQGSIISISDNDENSYIKPFEVSDLTWIASWASAQQALAADRSEYPPEIGLKGNTLRQIVRISTGGTQIKLKFTNEYGKTPLTINSAHIAKHINVGDSLIDTSTDTMVTFDGGCENVTIPAGETIVSDPIELNVTNLTRIAVSTYFGSVPEIVTSHTGSRTTSYLTKGNHVSDISMAVSEQMEHWYFLTGIDVISTKESKAVVCFGDSLTDGRGVTTNYDNRWTDILAERLQKNADTTNISVLNQGIGGNSVFGGLGPAGFKRFSRDVLEQDSVGYVIVLIGINDIGYAASDTLTDKIIEQYKNFADQAHAKEIKLYGGTILPFGNNKEYYSEEYGALREQIRQDINSWIRNNEGYFDAVIDFDAALKSPSDSKALASVYDCGDGLHLNPDGYKVMGELVDLNLFALK